MKMLSILPILGLAAAQTCPQPSRFAALGRRQGCGSCNGAEMPGDLSQRNDIRYDIHSDLPEAFSDFGVLYTTRSTIPNDRAGSISERMRRQRSVGGFRNIDAAFEVFMFHIARTGSPVRLVVHAQNVGSSTATVNPKQVIVTDGIIGTVHEMESNLGRRVMANNFDTPLGSVSIPAGQGRVVAFSKLFSAGIDNDTTSRNINCFGRVQATVSAASQLEVSVIAIPETNQSGMDAAAARLLNTMATSAETSIDLNTAPAGCALRRTVGVMPSSIFRSDPINIDVATSSPQHAFQMALAKIQAEGCPDGRQTPDLLLHPPYVRDENIGNYMMEYRMNFRVFNSGSQEGRFDLEFQKTDADVGLGWQILVSDSPISEAQLLRAPVRTNWAGPRQTSMKKSILNFDGGDIVVPGGCDDRFVAVRFMVLGNSSLPFHMLAQSAVGGSTP